MTAGPADRAAARARLSPRVIAVVLALIVLLTAGIAAEAVLGPQPVALLLTLASQSYVHQTYQAGGHALPVLGPAALILAQQFFVFFVAFPLIILLFPDGHLPSPRWRRALWLYLVLSLSAPLAELGVTIDVIALEPARLAVWLADGER